MTDNEKTIILAATAAETAATEAERVARMIAAKDNPLDARMLRAARVVLKEAQFALTNAQRRLDEALYKS